MRVLMSATVGRSRAKAGLSTAVVGNDPDRVRAGRCEDQQGAEPEPRRVHAYSPRFADYGWPRGARSLPTCGVVCPPVGLVERGPSAVTRRPA